MINGHWQHKLISSEIPKVHHKLTFTQKLLFLIHSSTPRKKSVHLTEKKQTVAKITRKSVKLYLSTASAIILSSFTLCSCSLSKLC